MLKKLQMYLEKYIHKDYVYLIICVIYLISTNAILFLFAYIYNFILFFIISFLFLNKMREYSYGFHMKDNISCMLFTIPILITFSYIAKSTQDYLWVVFFICLICMRDLYHKVPLEWEDVPLDKRWYNCKPFNMIFDKLKINRNKMNNVEYDYKWHRKRALAWISISYIVSILFFTFKMEYLCSCTLWQIIMVDVLLFKNID